MKKHPVVFLVALLLTVPLLASAATLTVPAQYPTIQAAIDAAVAGDVVVVSPGTYAEHIDFLGKEITVQSGDPANPDVVATTVIDGTHTGTVVTFQNGETRDSILSGFSIINGSGTGPQTGSTPYGLGIYSKDASPTIEYNVIRDCGGAQYHAYGTGGAIYCDRGSPYIFRNIIRNNRAFTCGAVFLLYGSAVLEENQVLSNEGAESGGGIMCIAGPAPTIRHNLIVGNTAEVGGGIYCGSSSALIESNTLWANAADFAGGNIYANSCSPVIRNCIIAHSGSNIYTAYGTPVVSYCNVFGGRSGRDCGDYVGTPDQTGSNGNISADPLFVDPGMGDFHLRSIGGHWSADGWINDTASSPCIDAGDPSADSSLEPAPNGGRIDMGYYGNTPYASKTSGVGPVEILETGLEYACIQNAIFAATDGQTIQLRPQRYYERINFAGKAVTVRSTNPLELSLAKATVLDGGQAGTVVTFNHGETARSVLHGVTVTRGATGTSVGGRKMGGGIYCQNSSPLIARVIMRLNSSDNDGGGVGCIGGNLVLANCLICDNSTPMNGGDGGGLACLDGGIEIRNCTISANTGMHGSNVYLKNTAAEIANTIVTFGIGYSRLSGGMCVDGTPVPTLRYCDVYGNSGGNYLNMDDPTGRDGNISVIPLFADAFSGTVTQGGGFVDNADYRLKSSGGRWNGGAWVTDTVDSSCIDSGDPVSPFENEPTPNGGRVNMGFDGNTAYASKTPAPPTVTASGPNGNIVGVTANINIGFSTEMTRPSAQNAMTINGVKASTFGGTFTWLGRKMTFNPTDNLLPGTSYKIVIGKSARSRAGVNMAKGFTWTFTTKPAAAAGLTVASAATASGAQITLNLASAADVTMSIRNLAGRSIALLQPGQMEAGVHSLLWNGKSAAGTKVPAGTYLLEAAAKSSGGTSSQVISTLVLR